MTKTVKYIAFTLSAMLISTWSIAEDKIPQRPLEETIENCKKYVQVTHQQLHDEYQRTSQCMSATPSRIAPGSECSALTNTVIQTVRAWPHCENSQKTCALRIAFDDALKCQSDAIQRNNSKNKKLEKSLGEIKEIETQLNNLEKLSSLIKDPAAFVEDKIGRYLEGETKTKFRSIFLDESGRITPLGVKDTNELYAWGFDKTTKTNNLSSNNSIIRAVQESSFTSISNIHQQMLGEMDALNSSIVKFGKELKVQTKQSQTNKSTTIKPTSTQASKENCSILNDGKLSSDLSIDYPEKFQELIKKCS